MKGENPKNVSTFWRTYASEVFPIECLVPAPNAVVGGQQPWQAKEPSVEFIKHPSDGASDKIVYHWEQEKELHRY